MSEDVGFSKPYGAILAKIRHLQRDNERCDSALELQYIVQMSQAPSSRYSCEAGLCMFLRLLDFGRVAKR